jgi:hypothetical protein
MMTLEDASVLLSTWIEKNPAEVVAQRAAVEQYGKLFHPENIDTWIMHTISASDAGPLQ